MSSFSFDVSLMSGIVDLGGGGGGGGRKASQSMNVSGRCMVARQESSALLGCRKKVFENARQMWFLVAAHLSSCHGGCGHDDALWSAAWQCITKYFLMAGKEIIRFFWIGAMAKKGTLSQHFVTHVVPPLGWVLLFTKYNGWG